MKTALVTFISFLLTAIVYPNETIRADATEFIRTVETGDFDAVYDSLHPKSRSEFEDLIHDLQTKRTERIDRHLLFNLAGIDSKEQFIDSTPKEVWKALSSDWVPYFKDFGEEVVAVSEASRGRAYVVTISHDEELHIMTDSLVTTYLFLQDGEKWKPTIPGDLAILIYSYFEEQ